MPARGDHEQRRREVALVAGGLVAQGGLAAATHRRIAEASGCSTTVVSHYFADKHDLVMAIYREVGDRVSRRLDKAATAQDPLTATLEALLPLDDDRERDWRLLFTFLGLAIADPDLTEEQRTRVSTARSRIQHALDDDISAGRMRSGVKPRDAARSLLSVVLGIGMQAVFDPVSWNNRRIRAAVRGVIADLRLPRQE